MVIKTKQEIKIMRNDIISSYRRYKNKIGNDNIILYMEGQICSINLILGYKPENYKIYKGVE